MGSWRKEDCIKKLTGLTPPTVTRNDKGDVLSVGMINGQRYYQYNKTLSKIDSSLPFEQSMFEDWGGFQYYLDDLACMIENGQIYIKYVKPVVSIIYYTFVIYLKDIP